MDTHQPCQHSEPVLCEGPREKQDCLTWGWQQWQWPLQPGQGWSCPLRARLWGGVQDYEQQRWVQLSSTGAGWRLPPLHSPGQS